MSGLKRSNANRVGTESESLDLFCFFNLSLAIGKHFTQNINVQCRIAIDFDML